MMKDDDQLDRYLSGETPLEEIWNSPAYQTMRAIVNDPEKAMKESDGAKESFCYGCSMVFDTNRNDQRRSASEYSWDDVFTMGPGGDPIRREESPQLKVEKPSAA